MKILVLTHDPLTPMKTRSRELAKALAALGHEVEIYKINRLPPNLSFAGKVFWHLRQIFRFPTRVQESENLYNLLLPNMVLTKPIFLLNIFSWLGTVLLGMRNYNYVINASYWGPTRKKQAGIPMLYDLVDDHSQEGIVKKDKRLEIEINKRLNFEMEQADKILTCSLVMQEYIQELYKKESLLVPNAAETKKLRTSASACKTGSISVGFIGGLDGWVDFDLVIDAIKILREQGHDIHFYIVGKGTSVDLDNLPDFCHYEGFVTPDKIPEIFSYFQIGLVPFKVSRFSDPVLPLKLMEYGAAKRISVATTIRELKLQKLPWVILAEPNPQDFAKGILQAIETKWDEDWNMIVDKFSWEEGAKSLIKIYDNEL